MKTEPLTKQSLRLINKAFGCGSVIASSAYATELLKGMSVEDAYKIKNTGKLTRHISVSKTPTCQASL